MLWVSNEGGVLPLIRPEPLPQGKWHQRLLHQQNRRGLPAPQCVVPVHPWRSPRILRRTTRIQAAVASATYGASRTQRATGFPVMGSKDHFISNTGRGAAAWFAFLVALVNPTVSVGACSGLFIVAACLSADSQLCANFDRPPGLGMPQPSAPKADSQGRFRPNQACANLGGKQAGSFPDGMPLFRIRSPLA